MNARQLYLRPGRAVGLATFVFLAGVGCWLLFRFDPAKNSFYPVCFLHQATGLQCPGCGSLRAMHQLLHGHLAAAWHFNPLLVGSFPLLGAWAVRFAIRKAQGRDAWYIRPAWLWAVLAVAVAFAILRNIAW